MSLENYQYKDSYFNGNSEFSGGTPVWVHTPSFRIVGGLLTSTFNKGELLHAGSPVQYDAQAHTAKILKCFDVTAVTVSGSNTIITVAKNMTTPELHAGMNIMVAPSTLAGTGKSVTLTAVDSISVANSYVITVVTANIDAVTTSSYLVEAVSQGSAVAMYCQPNTLLGDDLIIGDQNTVSIIKKDSCSIYRNAMPDLPAVVFAAINAENPMINYEYLPEIN